MIQSRSPKLNMSRILGATIGMMLIGILLASGTASADPYISMGDSTSTSNQNGEHSSYVDRLYSGFGSFAGLDDTVGADEHIALAQSGQVLSGLVEQQLPQALTEINAADDTKAVTIAIGPNDFFGWQPCFGLDTGCDEYQAGYDTLISQVKEALDQDPGVESFGLLAYYNPYKWEGSGKTPEEGESLDRMLLGANSSPDQCSIETNTGLNDIIFQAGSKFGAVVSNPYPAFLAGGGSLLRDPTHANAAGEIAIAEAFLDPVFPRDCNPVSLPDPVLPPEPVPPPTCETDLSLCPTDKTAPGTMITRKPARRSRKSRAVFRFRSTEPGTHFQCALNGRRFSRCSSPRIFRKLRSGVHRFRVRAVDGAGNFDPTPARHRFRIRRTKD